ncbi:MAG: hypothetical protein ABSG16_14435 [Candidatus Acidiferrum sp.]
MDKTQRGWAFASLLIFLASAVGYVIYALNAMPRPSGGSAVGLFFGIVGFAFMIFAALLGARKRVPVWRLGRAQAWMRGHLWLGVLSLPMILFHGAFHFGGTMTRVLVWLLMITVGSGIFGAILQNYLPRVMTSDVPLETIYDEIGNVRKLLREEADRDVESVCGPLGFAREASLEEQRAGGFTAMRPMAAAAGARGPAAPAISTGNSSGAVAAAPEIVLLSEEESAPLRRFYINEMRPFLDRSSERRLVLGRGDKAKLAFNAVRTLLPEAAQSTLNDLEDICDEARQLRKQEQLHHWMHGWLLVHIPLSLALILLGAVHAVMALRY